MNKLRLETFSDGVLAIIITIMVLEIKVPDGADFAALKPLLPIALSYILSFIYLAIYWNNHHHLMQTVKLVSGDMLWANMHLLFWLSLVPFSTGWMGKNEFAPLPVMVYGFTLLMAAMAYYLLQLRIVKSQGENSLLAKAIGKDLKGKISPILYLVAIPVAWFNAWIACAIYVVVAIMWLVPDRRIENTLKKESAE